MLKTPLRHAMPAGIAVLLAAHPAAAMQFTLLELPGNHPAIAARGVVVPGDFHRLLDFCNSLDNVRRIAGLVLDSPGGSVLEAEKIAGAVRDMKLTVAVPDGATCASACFLIFAASPDRIAAPDAHIGVHRASLAGHETEGSLAATDGMQVAIQHWGVPAAVVTKMTETAAGGVTWLTPSDLAAMHVTSTRAK